MTLNKIVDTWAGGSDAYCEKESAWASPKNFNWVESNFRQNIQQLKGGAVLDFGPLQTTGLTVSEMKTQFSLWNAVGSPLFYNRKLFPVVFENKELLELGQDTDRIGMVCVRGCGFFDSWTRKPTIWINQFSQSRDIVAFITNWSNH